MERLAAGAIKVIGLAWRGSAGKTVAAFAVRVLAPVQDTGELKYRVRIEEFKHCYYTAADGDSPAPSKSPLFTQVDDLPDSLKCEVLALLDTEMQVAALVPQAELNLYIERPGPCPPLEA